MLNIVAADIFRKKKKKKKLGLRLHNQHSHKIPDLCDRWLRKKESRDWAAVFHSAKPINSADSSLLKKYQLFQDNTNIYFSFYRKKKLPMSKLKNRRFSEL